MALYFPGMVFKLLCLEFSIFSFFGCVGVEWMISIWIDIEIVLFPRLFIDCLDGVVREVTASELGQGFKLLGVSGQSLPTSSFLV